MVQENAPVDEPNLASEAQITNWLRRFAPYRLPPTRETLLDWLRRFDPAHLPIAHKILDEVIIVSELEIQEGYRRALEELDGWSRVARERRGRWFFVGVGGAGESGPAMVRLFREANGLTRRDWQDYFVTPLDLPRLGLSAFDSVVFIDDFAGTGQQMVGYWPIIEELVASEAQCFLLLTALTRNAQREIVANTEFMVRADRLLEAESNVYSEESNVLDERERTALDVYGQIAWPRHPRGFGNCGLCFVLSHKTPNNSIPILHANHADWVGLFPRHLIRAP